MSKNHEKVHPIIELEFKYTYHFPILESIVAIMLFMAATRGIAVGNASVWLELCLGSQWDGSRLIERYYAFLEGGTLAYAMALSSLISVFVLLIPALTAFSLARSFEDGTLQTLLSYPLSRSRILLTKVAMILLLTCIPAMVLALAAVYIYIPGGIQFLPFLALSVAFSVFVLVVTSVGILISLISKRTMPSAAAGMLGWTGALAIVSMDIVPESIKRVINPVAIITESIRGEANTLLTWEIAGSLWGSFIVGIAIFVLGILTFERMEV
ncbi:MAG: ABC transporter permease [Candidatus Thorarchaeota archaeon]|nr:ABC transporter permease [Candidatus Thorarchaeota archaeon]